MRFGIVFRQFWREDEEVIYLDSNATTAMLPQVVEAMLPWLSGNHSNPSGSYRSAKLARKAIDEARGHVAELIGAEADEIVFTGSGTESVNTALHSLVTQSGEGRVLVSAIEHSAVLRFLEGRSRKVSSMPVDEKGRIDRRFFENACPDGVACVSVMAANNETGVLQPLDEVVKFAKERGLPVHTDAIQAVGKTRVDVKESSVDMLSLSAHKFHGPKGIGALYVRKGFSFNPLLQGGGQESGRRSGTENTAAIVAMGEAARLAIEALRLGMPERIRAMRDAFEERILKTVPGCIQNGDKNHRLPNTSHLSFDGCDAAGLLILLDEYGLACSAGSACMTGKSKPSHVQLAMGIPEKRAKSSLRFSFSQLNTPDEALEAAQRVAKAVEKLRKVQGHGVGPVAIYTD